MSGKFMEIRNLIDMIETCGFRSLVAKVTDSLWLVYMLRRF